LRDLPKSAASRDRFPPFFCHSRRHEDL